MVIYRTWRPERTRDIPLISFFSRTLNGKNTHNIHPFLKCNNEIDPVHYVVWSVKSCRARTRSGIIDNEDSMSVEYAFTLLESSSQSSTIWSTVYDMENLTVHVAMGRDYSDIYLFELMKSDS